MSWTLVLQIAVLMLWGTILTDYLMFQRNKDKDR